MDKRERAQVEAVFGVQGDLYSEPWQAKDAESDRAVSFDYWIEGVPDYAGEDFPDADEPGVSYRTVMADCLFGMPPSIVVDEHGAQWNLVTSFASSGAHDCEGEGVVTDEHVSKDHPGECYLCAAALGEEHGEVYLGDGWHEVVYKRVEDAEEPEESADEPVPCPTCGDEGVYLGGLGNREHYRCRACGIDFSREVR